MAVLSFLAPQPALKPTPVQDGMHAFFDGDLKIGFKHDGSTLYSHCVFKGDGKYNQGGQAAASSPPVHYHIYQDETFSVNSGTMGYLLDGVEGTVAAGKSVTIPPGHWHTFWNASTEDLDVTITTVGPGFDERFERNFYGYLTSMVTSGQTPNPLQALAFMWSADIVVQMPLGLGRAANYVLGYLVGVCLLGLQTEYKVYSGAAE